MGLDGTNEGKPMVYMVYITYRVCNFNEDTCKNLKKNTYLIRKEMGNTQKCFEK